MTNNYGCKLVLPITVTIRASHVMHFILVSHDLLYLNSITLVAIGYELFMLVLELVLSCSNNNNL